MAGSISSGNSSVMLLVDSYIPQSEVLTEEQIREVFLEVDRLSRNAFKDSSNQSPPRQNTIEREEMTLPTLDTGDSSHKLVSVILIDASTQTERETSCCSTETKERISCLAKHFFVITIPGGTATALICLLAPPGYTFWGYVTGCCTVVVLCGDLQAYAEA